MTDADTARAVAADVGLPGVPVSLRDTAGVPGAGVGTGHWRRRVARLHDPSHKLSRRQRVSPRLRHLHHLHCSLVALERAADTAVRLAVASALARPGNAPGAADVDAALVALGAAVDELAALTREVID